MSGLLIAVEGISGTERDAHAERLMRTLARRGVPTVLVPMPRPEAALPLTQLSAAAVASGLAQDKVVVVAPYVGTLLAYRAAAEQPTAADVQVVEQWHAAGLEPELTLVLDREPAHAVASGLHRNPAALDFHATARDKLLLLAGRNRNSWTVIDGGGPFTEVAEDLLSYADWTLRCQADRWPLDHGWRRLQRHTGNVPVAV